MESEKNLERAEIASGSEREWGCVHAMVRGVPRASNCLPFSSY